MQISFHNIAELEAKPIKAFFVEDSALPRKGEFVTILDSDRFVVEFVEHCFADGKRKAFIWVRKQ